MIIPVIDATEIIEPASADEALAYFILYATDGDTVTEHATDCPAHLDASGDCDCVPIVLEIGAKA